MNLTPKQLYTHLYDAFGPQHWWPMDSIYHEKNGSDPRFEIMIGAILTQNTAWNNVEKAIQELKKQNLLSIHAIKDVDDSLVKQLIKSSGYFNQKAKRLKYLARYLSENYDGNLNTFFSKKTSILRKELLNVHGIGPETADSILLYGGEKPVFVVDAYTKRLCERLPLPINQSSYEKIQHYFQDELTKYYANHELIKVYNELHALIVNLGKYFCRPKPVCASCPLLSYCEF
ncbi:MAG: endonuclease, partial [Candidatus Thermoplasmatota archaeon]|nr:endonuclease [Candidatus Thermoplasmatota archaeon]